VAHINFPIRSNLNPSHAKRTVQNPIVNEGVKSFAQQCTELGLDSKKTNLRELACAKLGLNPKHASAKDIASASGMPYQQYLKTV